MNTCFIGYRCLPISRVKPPYSCMSFPQKLKLSPIPVNNPLATTVSFRAYLSFWQNNSATTFSSRWELALYGCWIPQNIHNTTTTSSQNFLPSGFRVVNGYTDLILAPPSDIVFPCDFGQTIYCLIFKNLKLRKVWQDVQGGEEGEESAELPNTRRF